MYKGTKFNSRKENVQGQGGDYLGIQIFRFYMKCTSCSAEFSIKTDPKNMDYTVEGGAKRNFEPHKDTEAQKKLQIDQRKAEDESDKMTELENKTRDAKLEMDILDGLDDIRALNSRNARIKLDDLIAQRQDASPNQGAESTDDKLEEEVRTFAAKRARLLDDGESFASSSESSSNLLIARPAPVSVCEKQRLPSGMFVIQPKCVNEESKTDGANSGSSSRQRSTVDNHEPKSGLLDLSMYDSGSSSPGLEE